MHFVVHRLYLDSFGVFCLLSFFNVPETAFLQSFQVCDEISHSNGHAGTLSNCRVLYKWLFLWVVLKLWVLLWVVLKKRAEQCTFCWDSFPHKGKNSMALEPG